MSEVGTEMRGYMTTSRALVAVIRQPCPEHHVDGWQERAQRALTEGWPVDGYMGGPYDPDCSACQAMPPLEGDLGIVSWESTDPRVIGVSREHGAINEPNPIKRLARRIRG